MDTIKKTSEETILKFGYFSKYCIGVRGGAELQAV